MEVDFCCIYSLHREEEDDGENKEHFLQTEEMKKQKCKSEKLFYQRNSSLSTKSIKKIIEMHDQKNVANSYQIQPLKFANKIENRNKIRFH